MGSGANIKVRWAEAQASTSSSTLDLTSSGGGTCQAAVIWATRNYTNDDGGVERATMSVGFLNITGTTTADQHAIGVECESQVSTEEADKRGATNQAVMLLSYSGGSPILSDYAAFTTRVTDGIRLTANGGSNWGLAYRFKALLIFGDDAEIAVDVGEFITSGTQNTEVDVTLDSSFVEEPELIFFAGMNRSLDNTTVSNWQLSVGVGHSTGGGSGQTITQFSQTYYVKDGDASRAGSGYFYDTRCLVTGSEPPIGSLSTVELTDTAAGQFSVTLRDAALARRGMYLALSFKGRIQTYAKYWTYPDTTSGNISNTDIGFEPQCYLIATSSMANADKNTRLDSNLAHSFAWGGTDSDTAATGNIGCRLRNSSNWITTSYGSATYVVNQRVNTGGVGYRASHDSMLSNGIQLTVESAPAATRASGIVAFEVAPTYPKGWLEWWVRRRVLARAPFRRPATAPLRRPIPPIQVKPKSHPYLPMVRRNVINNRILRM